MVCDLSSRRFASVGEADAALIGPDDELLPPDMSLFGYRAVLGHTILHCLFWEDGTIRTPQEFSRALEAEAGRFERGEDWRGDNPDAAPLMAAELRRIAWEGPKQSRGRPAGENPARAVLEMLLERFPDELAKRGRSDLAASILDPGKEPVGGQKGGKASGLSTMLGVLRVMNEWTGFPVTDLQIRRAIDDVRRQERRKRAAAKKVNI